MCVCVGEGGGGGVRISDYILRCGTLCTHAQHLPPIYQVWGSVPAQRIMKVSLGWTVGLFTIPE